MELYQLKYFMETVKAGSMTKAARNLFVSQPAISQALGKLESELETSLFERGERNFTITETGKLLYVYAERILFELDSFYEEYNTGIKNKGLVFVSEDKRFEQYLLPQFILQRPDIKVQTQVVSRDMILRMLQGVNVDVAVTSGDMTDQKLQSRYVMDLDVFVLAPRSNPVSRMSSLKLSDLKGQPFIVYRNGEEHQKRFNESVLRMMPDLNVVYEADEAAWSNMQMNRDCFLFTNSYRLMRNDIYPYHKIIRLDEDVFSEKVYVTTKKKSANPNVQAFLDSLDRMFSDFANTSFYIKNGLLSTMANPRE